MKKLQKDGKYYYINSRFLIILMFVLALILVISDFIMGGVAQWSNFYMLFFLACLVLLMISVIYQYKLDYKKADKWLQPKIKKVDKFSRILNFLMFIVAMIFILAIGYMLFIYLFLY